MAHHVVDIVEREVIHVLTGDHADRLRRLPGLEHHAGGGGDVARRVRTGAFGNSAQLVGGNLSRPQFQCRFRAAGDQHIASVTLALCLQSAVGEQPLQAFIDAVLALQAGAIEVAGLFGIERNRDPRLYAKLGKGATQRAGADLVRRLALGTNPGGHQRQAGQAGKGYAKHRQANSAGYFSCGAGGEQGHSGILALSCQKLAAIAAYVIDG